MQFLIKNYEKILLGLVLLGLLVAVAFLPFMINQERERLDEKRNSIINRPVKELPPLELERYNAALKQAATPLALDLSTTNKLFNPVRWLRSANGPVKMPAGQELEKLEITKITPLYLNLRLDTINLSDSGPPRFVVLVEQQASRRGRRPYYVSVGDKKDLFNVVKAVGPASNPTGVVVELNDTGEQITLTKDKAFSRVDGYMADLRYPPETKFFLNRRVGDRISIAGEEYNIVAISENEVVLSARSNGKKYTIRYNATP